MEEKSSNKVNIQDILDDLADKVEVKKLPVNITEQISAVCNAIVKTAELEKVFFNIPNIYVGKKWLKLEHSLLSSFLINTAIKLRVDENKITTIRNEKALIRQFIKISSRKTSEEIINKDSRIKELPTIKKNRIKLKYPILAIGTKLYQEEYPGIIEQVGYKNMTIKYGVEVEEQYEHHIGFTIEPSHINYQRIINDRYNMYVKLKHVPEKGKWGTIKKLLKHIFGDSKEDLQMGLEYFWNLYVSPIQKMPFLGIVSEKKGTGKSTFLDFIHNIFDKNVAVVSGDDFTKEFNEHFVRALVITSDEHADGKERTKIAQKLKMYITEKNTRVEGKGKPTYTAKNFFKVIFAGNDEDMLTFIEEENTRYWILKLNKIDKTDIFFEQKLTKEISAFLYFLANDFKARKSRGRLYFAPKEFQTEAGRNIQRNSRNTMRQKIEEHITDLFETYPDLEEIYYTPKTLVEDMNEPKKEAAYIRTKVLKREMKMKPNSESNYFLIGCRTEQQLYEESVNRNAMHKLPRKTTGRYYTFKRPDFV